MAYERIQELIEMLKEHGVQSGEELGRKIMDEAHKKADEVLSKAKADADSIVSKAKQEADLTLKRLQSSLEIAASQFVGNLKRVVEDQLLTLPLKGRINKDVSDSDYLRNLITEFVKAYAANPQHADMQLLLPAGSDRSLMDFAMDAMSQYYGTGDGDKMNLVMETQGVKFGFQADQKQGNVRFDFTDEAFLAIFLKFLSPKFRELFANVKVGEAKK